MPTKSHPETDILKAIAVIAVILIHILAAHLNSFDKLRTWQANLNLAINEALRFCVPLFVALSGFGLAKKYSLDSTFQPFHLSFLKDFYLRRVLKLLPWFFAANFIIYFAVNWFFTFDKGMYENQPLWRIFLLGHADYHLYFVPMIFQLYLLFPILFLIVRQFPKLSLFLAIAWQAGLYLHISQVLETTNNPNLWPDQQQYFYFYSWIFYFILGISLALRSRLFITFLSPILLVFGFLWSEVSMFGLLSHTIDPIIATRFTRVPILLYSTGIIILSLTYLPREALAKWGLTVLLARLGRISYQTYLLHLLVLRFFITYTPLFSSTPLIISSVVIIAASFLLAEVLTRSIRYSTSTLSLVFTRR